jgi:protease-4
VLLGVLGLLVLGYLFNLALGILLGGAGAPVQEARLEETILEDNHSIHKIAVVPIDGIIMSLDRGPHNPVRLVKDQLKAAKADERVKAVVLKVDSPGGEVLASDDIARAIARFQRESGKPVIASMASMAASGGYYVSAPCRWIVAHELTITGSIGVIMQSYNFRGLMDKIGLRPQTFKSGRYKDMLSATKPESEITQEERDMVQRLVNETFEKFKSVVAEGRKQAGDKNRGAPEPGRALDAKWVDYADGRILSGKQAYELGFVDELGPFESAVERARKLAGIQDANLVQFQPVFSLSSLFRMFGRADVGRVKVDVGLEASPVRAGYLYFLAPNYAH